MTLRVENIERVHLALVGVAVCLVAALPWGSPLSLLVGGAVMGANFWLLRQIVARIFGRTTPRRAGVVAALLLAKFGLFLGLLGVLFWRVPLDAVSFAVGATLLLVACVGEAVRSELARA